MGFVTPPFQYSNTPWSYALSKLRHALNLVSFAAGAVEPKIGPAKVAWDVTYRCNLKCRHCHLWQTNEHNDLSTDEGKRLIDDLARIGTLHLSFSGGEPFMRADIHELASYARENGLTTAVNSNGTRLITPDKAKKACEAGIGTFFISLDGPDAETHNALRGAPHAFDSALRAIDNLIELRHRGSPQIFVNTTVTQGNIDRLEQIVELAREHGVDGMTMSVINDVGKYSPEQDTGISGSAGNGFSARLRRIVADSHGLIPHSQDYLDGFGTYLTRPNDLYRYRCPAGYATAVVHPDGEVHACPVAFASMGNLRERSFPEIWYSAQANRVRQRIKDNQHPICWFDCIAPLSVLLDDLKHLRVHKLLDQRILGHIVRKVSR